MPSRKPIDKNELFHEIYGVYFKILSRTIELAQNNKLNETSFIKMVEDIFPYMDAEKVKEEILKNKIKLGKEKTSIKDKEKGKTVIEYYKLFKSDLETTIKNKTIRVPFSSLQRAYLKTMFNDSRFRVFFSDEEIHNLTTILKDEEELFSFDDIVYSGKSVIGDPFDSDEYRTNFQRLLKAVQNEQFISVRFKDKETSGIPKDIEYSLNDNRFRFHISKYELFVSDIIDFVELKNQKYNIDFKEKGASVERKLKLEITDERNALQRCLVHFSHFEKECDKLDNGKYILTVNYKSSDEGEIVIRILQFGPLIKALEPVSVVNRIKEKVLQQSKLKLQK